MAVVKMPLGTRLQFKVQTGINASGAPVYATRGYNNVKSDATDANLYPVAQNLASLQQHTVVAISTVVTSNLVEQ